MSEDSSKTPARPPAAGFGSPLRVILTFILIFVLSQVLAILAVGLGYSFITGQDFYSIEQSTAAQFAYILIIESIVIGLVVFILKKRHLRLASIGLGRRPKLRDAGLAVAGLAAFYCLLILAVGLLNLMFPDIKLDQPQDVGFNQLISPLDSLLAFGALVLLAPVGEEVLVRGYFYSGLRANWRFKRALLVTGLVFGALHLQLGSEILVWGAALNTFVLSAVLVYLRERSGALYACILLHLMNNFVAFGVHFNRLPL